MMVSVMILAMILLMSLIIIIELMMIIVMIITVRRMMFFLFITKRTARIIPITKRTATTIPTAPPAFDWTGDVAMMYLRRMEVILSFFNNVNLDKILFIKSKTCFDDVPEDGDDNNVDLNNIDDDQK